MGAPKGFLTGVGPHVAFEEPWPREDLVTYEAFVGGLMGEQMHAKKKFEITLI